MIYTVAYKMSKFAIEQTVEVEATNRWTAYDIATYEKIPEIEGHYPYSTWVDSVRYKNGREHVFNTIEGLPY